MADPAVLDVLRSKTVQLEVATEVGLPILPSFLIGTRFQQSVKPEHFPLVLRPGREASVVPDFKMRLVEDEQALAEVVSSRDELTCSLVGQPFVNGPNLVVHGARAESGEHLYQTAFMASRKFEGVSLTIEPASLPADIARGCRDFVEQIGYVGVYHFELLLDPESGDYYFLEINGRLGGTTGKVFACGYDEPQYLLHAFNEAKYSAGSIVPSLRKTICTNKRSVAKALVQLVRGQRSTFDYPANKPTWRYALNLLWGLFVWRDEIFHGSHLRSGFAYTVHAALPVAVLALVSLLISPRTGGFLCEFALCWA